MGKNDISQDLRERIVEFHNEGTVPAVPHPYFPSFARINFFAAGGTVPAVPHPYFPFFVVINSFAFVDCLTEELSVLVSCSVGCASCSPVNGCLACRPPFLLTLRREGARQIPSCLPNCPPGFYKTRNSKKRFCTSCQQRGCADCSPRGRCARCTAPLLLYRGRCRAVCPPHTATLPRLNVCVRRHRGHHGRGPLVNDSLGNISSTQIIELPAAVQELLAGDHDVHLNQVDGVPEVQVTSVGGSRRGSRHKIRFEDFDNHRLSNDMNSTTFLSDESTRYRADDSAFGRIRYYKKRNHNNESNPNSTYVLTEAAVQKGRNGTSFGRVKYYSDSQDHRNLSLSNEVYGLVAHTPEESTALGRQSSVDQSHVAWEVLRRQGPSRRRLSKRRRRRRKKKRMRNKKRKRLRMERLRHRREKNKLERNITERRRWKIFNRRNPLRRRRRRKRRRYKPKNITQNAITGL
ncbi:Furin-like repeat [Trinorchestia longiramus]|nr:Furin-like repeat [Trinorchestia longiramus]